MREKDFPSSRVTGSLDSVLRPEQLNRASKRFLSASHELQPEDRNRLFGELHGLYNRLRDDPVRLQAEVVARAAAYGLLDVAAKGSDPQKFSEVMAVRLEDIARGFPSLRNAFGQEASAETREPEEK